MKKYMSLDLCIFALFLGACSSTGDTAPESSGNITAESSAPVTEPETTPAPTSYTYVQISQDEAKSIIDSDTPHIILDVRTNQEYDMGHIPGAIVIPVEEITESAPSILTDKNALILVYCRSGNRSKVASEALANMGYSNVREFGGIIDWQYETTR